MSPRNQTLICPNFFISNWLFVILLSPLPHPPSYSASYSRGCPEGDSGNCPAGHSAGNLENHLGRYSVNYRASHLDESLSDYWARCGDSSPARTLGWNLTRYPARSRTRSSSRCSRDSGRSSCGNSRTSSSRHSSGDYPNRCSGDSVGNHGGGMGGVGKEMRTRSLIFGKLGYGLAVCGVCAITHI